MSNDDLSKEFAQDRDKRALFNFQQQAEAMAAKSLESTAVSLYAQLQIHQKAIDDLTKMLEQTQKQNAMLLAEKLGFGLDYQDRLINPDHPEA